MLAATVIREDSGLTLEKTGNEVLGSATKVVISKDSTLIVTDGNTREAVQKRVLQIQKLMEVLESSLIYAAISYVSRFSALQDPFLCIIKEHKFPCRSLFV